MTRRKYQRVDLTCIFQKVDNIVTNSQCLNGIISRQADGEFRFEEAIRKGRAPLNPKLFDGRYVSMVRRKNGKYQLHMKTLADNFDRERLATMIYTEVCDALKIID